MCLVLNVPSAQLSLEYLTFIDKKLGPILSPQIHYFSDKHMGELPGVLCGHAPFDVTPVPHVMECDRAAGTKTLAYLQIHL